MQNYLKIGMVCIGLLANNLLAAELPKEMYMPNDADGFVVLTVEPCQFPSADKQGFHYRAYATEVSGAVTNQHEGCWNSPDVKDAPQMPGVKIIPLVNTWWNGDVVTYQQSQFGPEKKRWDIKLSPIEVKPNV